jgi:phosphate transport system substrate-binding protein
MTNNMITLFSLEGYRGLIAVDQNGTDAAIQQLCGGVIDIAMADRQMTAEESNACTASGRPPVAFHVATRGVIIAVARQNNFAIDVTSFETQQIFGSAINWSEVRAGWPEQVIQRYGPGTSSAEFQLFAAVVFGGNTSQLATALGAQYNDDVNVSLARVVETTQAIAFFDANFVLANSNLLRGVAVDGVVPDQNTIGNAQYPLAQPLVIYTTSATLQQKPQVADFTNYYINNSQQGANDVGLYPTSNNTLALAINSWFAATGQTAQLPTATPIPTQIPVPETTETAPGGEIVVDTDVEEAPPALFSVKEQNLLVNARVDLEALAAEKTGTTRPSGWSGNLDVNNPQLPLLIRLDLELLAATVYGANARPENWFGAVNSTKFAIARDIRHDLEILADAILGSTTRPATWAGSDALYRCDRSTQSLVSLLQKFNLYTISANAQSPDFCEQLALDISRFTEVNLLPTGAGGGSSAPGAVTIDTQFGVAFFDRGARATAGVIPQGTSVKPIARSYAQFSNMTLVEGDGFRIFIEWPNTTLSKTEWEKLPNEAEMEYETVCETGWC